MSQPPQPPNGPGWGPSGPGQGPQQQPPWQGPPNQGPPHRPPYQGPPNQVPPNQPGPNQPGPNQPPPPYQGPQQGYGQQGHGQQGYGPMPPGGPAPKKSRKLLIGIAAGVVGLIVLISGGVLIKGQLDRQAAEQAAAAHEAEKQRRADGATETVERYFAALSDGNAADALGLLSNVPDDAPLLADKAVKQSRDIAAVGGAEVGEVTVSDALDSAQVDATYTVGGDSQSYTFELTGAGDGWMIDNGLAELTLVSDGALQVNGQAIESGSAALALPGGYAMTTGSDRVQYTEREIVVGKPGPAEWTGTMELTDNGRKFALDQAKRSLDKCASAKELAPEGCPFGIQAGTSQKVDSGSIDWNIKNDPMRGAKVEYSPDVATIRTTVKWEFSATGTCRGGASCTFESDGEPTASFVLTGVSGGRPTGQWLPF